MGAEYAAGGRNSLPQIARTFLAFAVFAAPALLLDTACGHGPAQNQVQAARLSEPSASDFLRSVMRSLEQAHSGIRTNLAASSQPDLVALMTASQNAAISVRMAEEYVRPFAVSRDSNRSAAAQNFLAAYEMIEKSLAIQLEAYERMDSARTRDDLLGLRRSASDAQVAYQQGSSILLDAAALAFMSTEVADPSDTASHVALNMTENERQALSADVDSIFGDEIVVAPKPSDSGPLAAAKLLRTELQNQWRVAR